MKLGRAIKELRKEKGLSQLQLATAAKSTQAFLSQVERGFKTPNQDTLTNIARVLDISVAGLYIRSIGTEDIRMQLWGNPNAEFMLQSGKELILKAI